MRIIRSAILEITAMFAATAAVAQTPALASASKGSYTAGRFALEITAPRAAHAWLQSIAGGQAVSDLVTAETGPDAVQKKHPGRVTYTPITLRSKGPGLLAPFGAALDQAALTFDGRIVSTDYDQNIVNELSFTKGVITSITISALDASSRDPGTVEITMSPDETRMMKGSGKYAAPIEKSDKVAPLGFRVSMPGLEAAMSHVVRVETITMMHTGMGNGAVEYERALPGKWENGNIVLTLPFAYAKDLYQWQQDTQSGRTGAVEQTLDLHLLTGTREMVVLHASGVSLASLRSDTVGAGGMSMQRTQAELRVTNWQVAAPSTLR